MSFDVRFPQGHAYPWSAGGTLRAVPTKGEGNLGIIVQWCCTMQIVHAFASLASCLGLLSLREYVMGSGYLAVKDLAMAVSARGHFGPWAERIYTELGYWSRAVYMACLLLRGSACRKVITWILLGGSG